MLFTQQETQMLQQANAALQHNELGQAVDKAKHKELVLFVGPTGAGKSTLINYYLGTRYIKKGILGHDEHAIRLSGTAEQAKVGQSAVESQTLYPDVFNFNGKNYVLCDFSGFGETRGMLASVTGTGAAHVLVKAGSKIKNIVLVIDGASASVSRGGSLSAIFVLLRNVLGDLSEQKLKSVTFAITKLPLGVSSEQFFDRYIKGKLEQLERQANLNADEQTVLTICRHLKQYQNQLIVADACDEGESFDSLQRQIESSQPIQAADINLLQQDTQTQQFVAELTAKAKAFNDNYDKLAGLESRKQERQNICQAIANDLQRDKDKLDKEAVPLAKLSPMRENIQRTQQAINTCRKSSEDNNRLLGEKNGRLQALQDQIADIRNQTQSALLHSIPFSAVAQTVPETRKGERKYGAFGPHRRYTVQVPAPGYGSHTFNYNANAPVVQARLNGTVVQATINGHSVSYKHTYPLASGTTVKFEVYVRDCDLPDNQTKLQQLQTQVDTLSLEITALRSSIETSNHQLAQQEQALASLNCEVEELTKLEASIKVKQEKFARREYHTAQHIDELLVATQVDDNGCNALRNVMHANLASYEAIASIQRRLQLADAQSLKFQANLEQFTQASLSNNLTM